MSAAGEPWAETLAFHAYRSIAWLGRILPERWGRRSFETAGLLAHDLLPDRRAIVARNQAMVLGRRPGDPLVRASTRDAFASYARVLVRLVPLRGDDAPGGGGPVRGGR